MEDKPIELAQGVPVKFCSDVSVKMLEQLNKTFELLNEQHDRLEEEKRLRAAVYNAIAMLCEPMVYVKEPE